MWWRCCGGPDPAEKNRPYRHAGPNGNRRAAVAAGDGGKGGVASADTDKAYGGGFQLGVETDTQDSTGAVLPRSGRPASRGQVESALERFQGEPCSCPHILGGAPKRTAALRELAREGQVVERLPRPVVIREAKLLASRCTEPARQALPRLLQGHLCAFGDCGPRRGAGNLWHDDGAAAHAGLRLYPGGCAAA